MDPFDEQRLRNEVIYLHSLWHQGPPPSRSFQFTNLQPLNSTNFKKHTKKTPKFKQPKKLGNFSGTEWPVKPPPADPPLNQSGWPELKLKPKSQQTLTPEELEKHNWNQIQQKALKSAQEFFQRNSGSDEDDDDDMEEDEDENENENVHNKEYDFFWKLVDEDEELKSYYTKYCGGGSEIWCLVCCGSNEKYRKKFRDCIALVQHSTRIAKTKNLRSHRAYGQVICKVLGWDINHLPSSIVTDHNSRELQGNDVNNVESNFSVDNNRKAENLSETVNDESMVCAESSLISNVEEEENNIENQQELNTTETGAVTNLCTNLSSTRLQTD